MKYIKRIGLWIVLNFLMTTSIASAHFTGSGDDHGTYLQELLEWPPHLRQLHYYAEVGGGLLIIGFVIVGVIQNLKKAKKKG